MIQGLSSDFSTEIKSKQDSLDLTQAHLRAATRSLSEQRKQIQHQQAECAELDLITQRTRNLEKALQEEDNFDWTGRTELDGSDASVRNGSAFKNHHPGSVLPETVDLSFPLDEDIALPTTDSAASLVRLRRIKIWQTRMDKVMEDRINRLKGASAEKEFQCKKIVSMCTGIPMDKVEDVSFVHLQNYIVGANIPFDRCSRTWS